MCKNNCNCISDILKVIYLLQENSEDNVDCLESCDKPTLGRISNTCYNTRPVILYTCNSNGTTPWSAPTTRTASPESLSSIFRIEKIDDCCATFRVLVSDGCGFTATDSFFTINLECICAIRCLGDTFVDNL